MKPHYKPLATALAATLQLAVLAAVPLAWDVRPGQPAPATFDRYHGETLSFSATFRSFGELPFAPGADIRLWYQTNGMGSAWWSVPATIQSNVLSATWSPALDPGADRVSLFFGAPSNAYAAAVLRLRHSPGFAPGAMPDPETFHESDPVFAAWLAAFSESDPVFTSWLSTFEIPETSLEPSTNYTDRALGAFASTGAVSRAAVYGTPTRWTDATGCVWEVGLVLGTPVSDTPGAAWLHYEYWPDDDLGKAYMELNGVGWEQYVNLPEGWTAFTFNGEARKSDYSEGALPYNVTFVRRLEVPVTNLVGRIALTNDIPAAPDLSPIQQDIADLRTENAVVYRLYSGSNIVAEVTNFSSQVHAPELRLMQLNESNEYVTVWAETNGLTRTLKRANEYTDNATGAVARASAPRAWGRTTSGLGADAPSNTTWISTEKLVIASGLEYVHIDSAGVWILCANGQVDFSTPTNSFFSISTDSGENVFSVERTDSRPIPVDCGGINVVDSGDNKVVTIPVPVFDATENANEPPFLNVGLDLKGPWYSETNGIPSTVVSSCTWSGQNGAWTNTIVLSASHPSAFFNYSKWQAGGTVIRNKAAMEVSGGVLCTDGIHKGRPVYNNGTIIWEVVP